MTFACWLPRMPSVLTAQPVRRARRTLGLHLVTCRTKTRAIQCAALLWVGGKHPPPAPLCSGSVANTPRPPRSSTLFASVHHPRSALSRWQTTRPAPPVYHPPAGSFASVHCPRVDRVNRGGGHAVDIDIIASSLYSSSWVGPFVPGVPAHAAEKRRLFGAPAMLRPPPFRPSAVVRRSLTDGPPSTRRPTPTGPRSQRTSNPSACTMSALSGLSG